MQEFSNFNVYNASAGSGKTFTLVKEFLKILLSSDNPYKFQQILAVTFTNKAAAEMKERIIENLSEFSSKNPTDILPDLSKELGISDQQIFTKSKHILGAILQNYSGFNVTTIDSFTHKLVKTFAFDLKLPLNFDVEMDAVTLLNDAVELLISKIGEDKELTKVLVNYSIQNVDNDKDWDISKLLKNFVKIILNENNSEPLESLKKRELSWFINLKKELIDTNKNTINNFETIGKKGLALINGYEIDFGDFAQGGELPNHFKKLDQFQQKYSTLLFEGRLNTYFDEKKNFYSAKCSISNREKIEMLMPELEALYEQSKQMYFECFNEFVRNILLIDSLTPLAVLNSIYQSLTEIKTDNNILLHAEFNKIISDSIKNEPAPFIYERLGEKFRYYFIDEMQDTSVLQWNNSIPLIENAISSENEQGETGKLMLVGDAKQSIYRWRGGKAEQFISLSSKRESENPFNVAKKVSNLDTNFRSYSQIIDFNNSFFTFASGYLGNSDYQNLYKEGSQQLINTKIGGYVQFDFVDKKQDEDYEETKNIAYPKKVFEIISNLEGSFDKSEICVLVRKNTHGIEVANYLSANGINIISSESLLLNSNEKVLFLINLLSVIENSLNKDSKIKVLYFLYKHLKIDSDKHEFYQRVNCYNNAIFFSSFKQFEIVFNEEESNQVSLYELVEYCIQSFKLTAISDAYLQFFLDVVFEYQQKNGSDLVGFLDFWKLKNEKFSIVATESKNSVRIMTIHKAKGLEFPVVIFPYDVSIYNQIDPKVWYNLDYAGEKNQLLINSNAKLKSVGVQGEQLFLQQQEELELDNFNILYVALTRAKEQMYIVSEFESNGKEISDKLNKFSNLYLLYLQSIKVWNAEKRSYSFGDSKRLSVPKIVENNTIIHQKLISNSLNNSQIKLATNSSLLWGTEQGEAIINGNLWHEIMAKIKVESDIDEVISSYFYNGILSENEKEEITIKIKEIVNHPELYTFFGQNSVVLTEQEIVTSNNEILIPDRLIFSENEVTIIDYKTGVREKKHQVQIDTYAKALEKMNYTIGKRIIVYIGFEITLEEV